MFSRVLALACASAAPLLATAASAQTFQFPWWQHHPKPKPAQPVTPSSPAAPPTSQAPSSGGSSGSSSGSTGATQPNTNLYAPDPNTPAPGGEPATKPPAPPPAGAPDAVGYTLWCRFTAGPRKGATVDFSGRPGAVPVLVGSPCSDMQGSNGTAITSPAAAPAQQPGQGRYYQQQGLQAGYTLTCRFTSGPKAGQTADFSQTLGAQPVPLGAKCSDGAGSDGVGVGPQG